MKPQKVVHVTQKHKSGCLVACIAMVLGWEYDAVVNEFHNDFSKSGVNGNLAREFICDHGFSVIEKRGVGYQSLSEHNKRMMVPFAPIHIVSVRQFIDTPKTTHAFIMDGNGKIFDPHDKDQKKTLFYYAEHVMGFYKT